MPEFSRYVGIDYSGAEVAVARLKGLRVYLTEDGATPGEVPPPSAQKYWTRRGIAEWLVDRLAEDVPTLIGIDHAFSFPWAYFEKYGLTPDWPAFMDDFQSHWPTDRDHMYVDFVREGVHGNGAARTGNSRWRRLTDRRSGGAKSVFHFDVPGQVAKSTHAGIPWLRFIRGRIGSRVHFWPFDGWDIPTGRSAIVEVYPALWKNRFSAEDRTADQHDAYCAARWMSDADRSGLLPGFLSPELTPRERELAQVEGWILGVPGMGSDGKGGKIPPHRLNIKRTVKMNVVGTWRLVRAISRDGNGNELPAPYGGHPMGRVVLAEDGRMMAMTGDARPDIPDGGKREYSTYCGNYTFDGKQLITRVDASSDPSRVGTDQVRDVRFDGPLMVLRPPLRSYGGAAEQRELYWEKIAPI